MLAIGNIEIEHPFTLAAIAGYSDVPMRRVARMHGAAFSMTGVVPAQSVLHAGQWRDRLLRLEPEDHPVGAQLMGTRDEEVGPAARTLAEAGYDVIDLNFGCPAAKAMRRHCGGHLLAWPQTALACVRRTVDAVAGLQPVTIKLRRGIDDSADSERAFFTILDGALAAGISAITVHPRTVRQRYAGTSDWAFLKRVKQHVGATVVIGSGDLFTAEACIAMLRETGVDMAAIARGAIGNPWIFGDCRALADGRELPPPPLVAEQRRTIARHYDEMIRYYGEPLPRRLLSKFAVKYCTLHPKPRLVREAFASVRTIAEFREAFERWYEPSHVWPPVVRRRDSHGPTRTTSA